jgi:hypothetical protein
MFIQGDIIVSWTWWRPRLGLGSCKTITPWIATGLYLSVEGRETGMENLALPGSRKSTSEVLPTLIFPNSESNFVTPKKTKAPN